MSDWHSLKYWYIYNINSEIRFLKIFIENTENQIDLNIEDFEGGIQTAIKGFLLWLENVMIIISCKSAFL